MDYPEKKPSSEKKRKPQEKDIREKPNTPHKDGWISRGYGMLQDFYTKIISAENEDDYDD